MFRGFSSCKTLKTFGVRFRRAGGAGPGKKRKMAWRRGAKNLHRGKKRIRVDLDNGSMLWCNQTLSLEKDDKMYHPFMNDLRDKGYWLPHWLDLHPERTVEETPENIQSEEHDLSSHSTPDYTDSGWKITKQRLGR